MTFGQFIGQVKAGKGMAAIARESNRLGVRKIENGLRIGVSIHSQGRPAAPVGRHRRGQRT